MICDIVLEVLGSAIMQYFFKKVKKKRKHIDWKGIILSLFAEDMVVYIENPKESTSLLEVISMFSSVMYKNNTEKSVMFLYFSNEHLEKPKLKIQCYLQSLQRK